MRFSQKDYIFNQYEWSGTDVSSYNKTVGLSAFFDFDYSNFADIELRFLMGLIKGTGFSINGDHASTFLIPNNPIGQRRWYVIDEILNFAPTNIEILKSIYGDGSIWGHWLSDTQVNIISNQFNNVIGLGQSSPFLYGSFNNAVENMGNTRSPLDCANAFNGFLGIPRAQTIEYNDSRNPADYYKTNDGFNNTKEAKALIKIIMRLGSFEYLSFSKIDVFDPFIFNRIALGQMTRQRPLYFLWLAAHKDYRNIAKDYGISIDDTSFDIINNQNMGIVNINDIKITVDGNYIKQFTSIGDYEQTLSFSDIIPGTEQIQTPFSTIKGIPRPSSYELMFYLRLFHGIAGTPDEKTDISGKPPLSLYNTKTKQKILESNTATSKKSNVKKLESLDSIFPYRMRYVNQFLLPEPFFKNPSTKRADSWQVKFERPSLYFMGTPNKTIKITPENRKTSLGIKNQGEWYYGLWCLPIDPTNERLVKYYPTGYNLGTYDVIDTHTDDSIFKNYTEFDSNSNEIDSIKNVTYWFNSSDNPIDDYQNKTPNGKVMHQNGVRGGIPIDYLSILRIEAEVKGRELLKEAENFSDALYDGIQKEEILPVSYKLKDVSDNYKNISDEFGKKTPKILISNPSFKQVVDGTATITINSPSGGETEKPYIDSVPFGIGYISNLKNIPENHKYFKYHERPWNKKGTGIYPKIGDPFSPSTWLDLVSGNHSLNRVYPERQFEADFPASVFNPSKTAQDNLCSPVKNIMYPRTLIEPDFASVLSKPWLDLINDVGVNETEIKHKIYLQILHANASAIKKLKHIALMVPLNETDSRETLGSEAFSISIEQRKIFEQILYGTTFGANQTLLHRNGVIDKTKTKNLIEKFSPTISKVLKEKSTEQVYWGLNATTAIFQLTHSVVDSILEKLPSAVSVGTAGIVLGGTRRYFILAPLIQRVSNANAFMYDIIYSKWFKVGSTSYKLFADAYGWYYKGTTIAGFKFAVTVVNSAVSLWGWKLIEKNQVVLNLFKKAGLDNGTKFGWFVTLTFLVVTEILDSVELDEKREKLKNLFNEAFDGGYIEGPYVQSAGMIRIKKAPDGRLPVSYDQDGSPIEYQNIKNSEPPVFIKTYEDLMGDVGESNFWRHLSCEDAKELKAIIDRNGISNGPFGFYDQTKLNSAQRITDIGPNRLDFGVHTRDKSKSIDGQNLSVFSIPIQYEPISQSEPVPYINVKLLFDNLKTKDGKFSFYPNFKYTRLSDAIQKNTPLSDYFNGKYGIELSNIEKGISLNDTTPPFVFFERKDIPLTTTGISDKEKIYLIRKKYGLDAVNDIFGVGCCNMNKIIDNDDDNIKNIVFAEPYNPDGGNRLNDGIENRVWTPWIETRNLNISDKRRNSLTRWYWTQTASLTGDKTNYEYQGCEYKVTLSTQEVYNKIVDRINECSNQNEISTCFDKDVRVLTPTGEIKISDISIGDEVIAFDEHGDIKTSTVTKIFYHEEEKSELFRYTLEDDSYLDVTKNHPVLMDNRKFVEIGNLHIGDYLIGVSSNKIQILDIQFLKHDYVYNITVDEYSTYIANGIRVHNKPVPVPIYNDLPVTRYDDTLNAFAESLIEIKDIDEMDPELLCQTYGICNDVTCATCNPSPRFLKVCSIPELCLPPKYSKGIHGSMPAWLYSWISYDYRNEWSSIIRTYSDYRSWWENSNKPKDILLPFKPFVWPEIKPIYSDTPLGPDPRRKRGSYRRRELGNSNTTWP